jgi:hypothetical protein
MELEVLVVAEMEEHPEQMEWQTLDLEVVLLKAGLPVGQEVPAL